MRSTTIRCGAGLRLRMSMAPLLVLMCLNCAAPALAAWEWQNPLPQGNHLYAVWGGSGSDVFAVGKGGPSFITMERAGPP